jgi:hypothetical protein
VIEFKFGDTSAYVKAKDRAVDNPNPVAGLEMPETALYGRLGRLAKEVNLPISASYPALIGVFSIIPDCDEMVKIRINQYVAILGQTGHGKNVAMDRAIDALGISCTAPIGQMTAEHTPTAKAAPTGARQLMQLIGDKAPTGKGAKSVPRIPGPRKFLLRSNEIDQCFKAAKGESSTLISRFTDFWDENEFSLMDGRLGQSSITANCRLSWIGGLPTDADNPEKFLATFGSSTGDGLYNRFLFGLVPYEIDFDGKNAWNPPDADVTEDIIKADYTALAPKKKWSHVVRFDDDAWSYLCEWRKPPIPRCQFHAKKVAILTASANLEESVTLECVKAACVFMEWQAKLRSMFAAGVAENVEGQFYERAITKLESMAKKGQWFNVTRLSHDLKWSRKFGGRIVASTFKGMADQRIIVPVYKGITELPNSYFLNPKLYDSDEYALNTAAHAKNREEHQAALDAQMAEGKKEEPKDKAKRLAANRGV